MLSVLLLVIITFAVGILLYTFVMGIVGNVTETLSVQPFSLFIENVNINDTCITVYIRNSSNKNVIIKKVYVNNEPCDFLPSNSKITIPKNSTGKVYIPGSYTRGALYEFKIICTPGYTLTSVVRY